MTSPSAFLINPRAQGLFSAESAFQKPKHATTLQKTIGDCPKQQSSIFTKNLQNSQQFTVKKSLPIKIAQKTEDLELLFSAPVKKVKTNQDQATVSNLINIQKPNEAQVKTSMLTIEEVFNSSNKATKSGHKLNFFDDESNEGSSLSFISSVSSLDCLDEMEKHANEVEKEEKQGHHYTTYRQNDNIMNESLVINDDAIRHFNSLQANYFSPLFMNYPMMMPLNQQNLQNLQNQAQVGFAYMAQPYSYSNGISQDYDALAAFNLTHYNAFPFAMNFSEMNATDLVINPQGDVQEKGQLDRVKVNIIDEEDYDYESYATRSTGLAESLSGDKSQKGESPLYSMSNEDIILEERLQEVKRQVRNGKERKTRQGRSKKEAGVARERKVRPSNLEMDINPKHLKVERRLNRLQLLRYQQESGLDIEEVMKQASPVEQETQPDTMEYEATSAYEAELMVPVVDYEALKAEIPAFNSESIRKRSILTSWTPENMEPEAVENFLQQISEIIEAQVTNQEAALKILKTFGMDVSVVLESVKANKEFYTEIFRIKVKRGRGRKAAY